MVKEKGLRVMDRGAKARICFFVCLGILFSGVFLFLCTTELYNVSGGHNDRFFSADDLYYVEHFFGYDMDTSPRVIKHPLLIVAGWIFARAERIIFGEIGLKSHYQLIVATQILVFLLSAVYLERLLRKHFGLDWGSSLLMTGLYSASFSVIFYTFIGESYIISALIIIMSFYYAAEGKGVILTLLGVAAAGVTITNAFIWAIIAFFACPVSIKRRLGILISAGVLFCAVTYVSPVGKAFFSQIISGGIRSANNYSDSFTFSECLKRIFFAFFGSTMFFIHTANASPFGEFTGDAMSFVPSGSTVCVLAMVLWIILIGVGIYKGENKKLLIAPIAVLAFNLLLHGAVQYGLKEGFLYSLHHFPAQILAAAPCLGRWKGKKLCVAAVSVIIAAELWANIPGVLKMIELAGG